MSKKVLRREDYTVAWICALPVELAAARLMLEEEHDNKLGDQTVICTLGRILDHNVVIVGLPAGRMGTESAAATAAQVLEKFPSIRCGLMVGIGGGVPSDTVDIRLGDVVVSQPQLGHGGVIQYDFGKTKPNGFERTGYLNAPPLILLNITASLQAANVISENELDTRLDSYRHMTQFSRDSVGPDLLFQADYLHVPGIACERCDTEKLVQRAPRPSQQVRVHYGAIASGNQVMRDGLMRDTLSAELGGVLCFEMEAAGLMNRLPCLVIRGICDYADSHKIKKWQPHAAFTAAAYAKEVLSLLPAAKDGPSLLDTYEAKKNHAAMDILQTKCQQVLDSLAFPQIHRRQNTISRPCHGTADWLTYNSDFLEWMHGDNRFLWLKGKAGAGKSVLVKRTLDIIHQHAQWSRHTVAAFFYDASGTHLERSTAGFMRTILYDIFSQNQDLLEQFIHATDAKGFVKGAKIAWQDEELNEVLRILAGLSNWKPTIILADALDEGIRNETRSIVTLLEDLFPICDPPGPNKLRVLFSSRHYPNIVVDRCFEIWVEENNGQDIETFTHQKLTRLPQSWEKMALIESVLKKADGVFLWVQLAISNMLEADDDGSTFLEKRQLLAETPYELDDVYTQVFQRLSAKERMDTFQVLKWVLFSLVALSPKELCFALQFDTSCVTSTYQSWKESAYFISQGDQMSRFIRSRSRGLLETRRVCEVRGGDSYDTIQFIHQTVPEFLLRKGLSILRANNQVIDMADLCHCQIFRTCMQYLAQPEIIACPSMTLLRWAVRSRGQSFLEWVHPQPTDETASQAYDLLASRYISDPESPIPSERPWRLQSMNAKNLTELVYFDLPLLNYSVKTLHLHLKTMKPFRPSQPFIFDLLKDLGAKVLPLWYSLQDAWHLPREHLFHTIDWVDWIQVIISLELEPCVIELKDRVMKRAMPELPLERLDKALHVAVNRGLAAIVHELILCGANPNYRGRDQRCLLDNAVEQEDLQMVQTLLRSGANPRTQNHLGFTPLHHAASIGNSYAAAAMIDAGADINARLSLGNETPLLLAAAQDQVKVLDLLLSRGANLRDRNSKSYSVFELAYLNRAISVHSFLYPGKPLPWQSVYQSMKDPISRAMTATPSPEKQLEYSKRRSSRFDLLDD